MSWYFFVLSLVMMNAVCGTENSEPSAIVSDVYSDEVKKVELERVSIKRIMSKRKTFSAKIKRSKTFVRAFYFTGGALTMVTVYALVRYIVDNWSGQPLQEHRSSLVNVDYNVRYNDPGLQEFIRRERENRTFSGRVKNTLSDGFNVAVYTFVAAVVLNLFYYAEGLSLRKINDLLNEDEVWLFRLSYEDITRNIQQLQSSTYAFINDLPYIVSDNHASLLDFRSYFNGDVVVDAASMVNSVEEVIAIISESFHTLSPQEQTIDKEIDELIDNLIGQTNEFVEYLESIVNAGEPFDVKVLMKQAHLLFKKFSVTITNYAAACGSLMFGKVFARQREVRL